jgi:hypothetical protein
MRLVRAKRISLPLDEFLQFLIVVLAKFATDGLFKIGQLALVTPRIGHQVGHHAAWFLPTEVGVLKFCAADMRAKRGKKHRNKGLVHVFEAWERSKRIHSVPLPRVGILGAVLLLISYFIVFLLFRRRMKHIF